ncbi:MAG: outer membrane protein assembly factor BamB family protein [Planctomycetaceae bacterium]
MTRRLLVLLTLGTAPLAAPGEGRPRHNTSYVPADDEPTRALLLAASKAAAAGDAGVAAGHLQALLQRGGDKLLSMRDPELFVSARRWAALHLLAERAPFERAVLDTWRRMYGDEASLTLRAALAADDEEAVLTLLDSHPAATAAPEALFALCDRALLRGDRDAALGFLDRVPEHVPRSEWGTLAQEPYQRRRAFLDALREPRSAVWPTPGGGPARSRTGEALPAPNRMKLLWVAPLLDQVPEFFRRTQGVEPPVQSAELPFEPVLDEERVYIHLGRCVLVIDRRNGELRECTETRRHPGNAFLESVLQQSPGARAPTVDAGMLFYEQLVSLDGVIAPTNRLVAYDVAARRVVWSAPPRGQPSPDPVLARGVFFRGAPAVAGGKVYVYAGAREAGDSGPTRKEEAYLFCFRRADGALLWRRFLGYADTDAPAHFPPLGGVAPAVARGVVVAVTGLGVAAALDARTGEVLWLLRYNRLRPDERERLTDWSEETVPVKSGWLREAPRIVGDTVYLAPFDSEELTACWLRGRTAPADGGFDAVQWEKHRNRQHHNCQLETIAGFFEGRIYCAGRPDERQFPGYENLVSVRLADGLGLAYGRLPRVARDRLTGASRPPEIFGRSTIAGGTLLLPTAQRIYRFDLERIAEAQCDGELSREIRPLDPLEAAIAGEPLLDPVTGEEMPVFGTLVASGGCLYAAAVDRLFAFGPSE